MAHLRKEYSFDVWGTQGGGLVRSSGENYIFVEAPDPSTGLNVGDFMLSEWGVAPANEAAMRHMNPEHYL